MTSPWNNKRPLSAWIPAGISASKKVHGRTERPVILASQCTQCSLCWVYCPEGIITRGDPYQINYDYCHGCGICAIECPRGAIIMEEES